ncbi:MAG: hypothetical protein ACK41T_06655 [Pseudobdellovibrio sp.]
MKLISMFIFTLIISSSVFAYKGVENSSLSQRHQVKIEEAILKQCVNLYRYDLLQLGNYIEYKRIDNGIVDEYHTTTIKLTSRLDQIVDESILTVDSSVSSGYDHQDKDWGLISIESIKGCP